ncbi:F0F1 ATP synthase subunit epsilon [Candidatus Falkowbacteria bacterium CG10_big_fil_rev_8_21_14_0_10_44_15]|uniref:ATP synthase epsilon chain n=1 Tax=Candidatus Falkowbacteria bacterium CG10_big_fil_rev_8_21_14_0_10_44_15 TaxID=1974569 RepID=A0A2H0UYY6_9BACT|nr:MAG: F0F1 ATP synthase subunit epsilon [Candidatus Falkowbacteria bacterium CG10_big_fil_rev_8_21_14_0_10_44_15]
MSTIHFEIVTPEKVVLKEEVLQLTVPTKMGEITILPHHIPLVASLIPGVIEVKKTNNELETVALSGGFIEVLPTKVVILADTAERAADIDEARAEEARQRAEKLMTEKREEVDFSAVQAKIAKELARVKAVRRHRNRHIIKTD